MEFSFANPRTRRLNTVSPSFGVHVFRPKRPGSALSRAGFIDGALLLGKVNTVGTPVFSQVIKPIGLSTVLVCELTSGGLEKLSQVFPIFAREIDIAVFTTRSTAVSRLLTFKANTLTPPGGPLSFTHFLQCRFDH